MHRLGKEQLLLELRQRPGLIPVGLDPSLHELTWLDMGTYHVYEGFFHRAISGLAAMNETVNKASPPDEFVTDFSVLADDDIVTNSLKPTAFIFHAGRCGSTLLTRVLARDRRHLVIGEAAAHNHVWVELMRDGRAGLANIDNQRIYTRLLLAMGRKRLPAYRHYFVKFTSFNVLFFDFIRSAFPTVPTLFLYRHPAEVIASYERNPPGWLLSQHEAFRQVLASVAANDVDSANTFCSPAAVVTSLFAAALRAGRSGIKLLNYSDLTPDNLPTILVALGVEVTASELPAMQSQFQFDSKADARPRKFVARANARKGRSTEGNVDEELAGLYAQLAESSQNLIKPN